MKNIDEYSKIFMIKNKKLLYLLEVRTGGRTTMTIIDKILEEPKNRYQLSKELGLNYSTVDYHLKMSCKLDFIHEEKMGNYFYYFPTENLFNSLDEYYLLKEHIEKKV